MNPFTLWPEAARRATVTAVVNLMQGDGSRRITQYLAPASTFHVGKCGACIVGALNRHAATLRGKHPHAVSLWPAEDADFLSHDIRVALDREPSPAELRIVRQLIARYDSGEEERQALHKELVASLR